MVQFAPSGGAEEQCEVSPDPGTERVMPLHGFMVKYLNRTMCSYQFIFVLLWWREEFPCHPLKQALVHPTGNSTKQHCLLTEMLLIPCLERLLFPACSRLLTTVNRYTPLLWKESSHLYPSADLSASVCPTVTSSVSSTVLPSLLCTSGGTQGCGMWQTMHCWCVTPVRQILLGVVLPLHCVGNFLVIVGH